MKENENESIYIHLIVSKKFKKELQEEADEKQLPLASYIRFLLTQRNKDKN